MSLNLQTGLTMLAYGCFHMDRHAPVSRVGLRLLFRFCLAKTKCRDDLLSRF